MKKFLLFIISFYQSFLVYFIKNIIGVNNCCRYEVTCSAYSKNSIKKYGVIKGVSLSIRRILSCQPFYNNVSNI